MPQGGRGPCTRSPGSPLDPAGRTLPAGPQDLPSRLPVVRLNWPAVCGYKTKTGGGAAAVAPVPILFSMQTEAAKAMKGSVFRLLASIFA